MILSDHIKQFLAPRQWRPTQDSEVPEGITGLLLITTTMISPFERSGKTPWPSCDWPDRQDTFTLHETESKRFNRWAIAPDNNAFSGDDYGDLFICRILSVFILTTIVFLKYLLLLTFPSTGTPPRCRCIRLSKRGGWRIEDQCDFIRRLRLCGLLAGNLSSRKKRNRFSHFCWPLH